MVWSPLAMPEGYDHTLNGGRGGIRKGPSDAVNRMVEAAYREGFADAINEPEGSDFNADHGWRLSSSKIDLDDLALTKAIDAERVK